MRKSIEIEEIINKATDEAIKRFDEKKRIEKRKKVFHNTELLLKNYNSLREHYEKAVDSLDEFCDEDLSGINDEDELYIRSIRRSKFRTFIMISHIEMAIEALKKKMNQRCQPEKYRVIEMLYLEGRTFESIAEKLNCGERTVRRWKNEMIDELSILIFGIDGLKVDL